MSTETIPTVREYTRQRLAGAHGRYSKDIKHFTDEQFTASPGGKARSPLQITAEVGMINDVCAKLIKGEAVEGASEEGFAAAMAQYNTRDKAVGLLNSGTAALDSALANVSDADLQTEVSAPWGGTCTKQYLADACCMNVDYHDGQLNLVQCMNGDTTIHWMEE
ncbi:MAG TPA: hypothetical protein VNI20_01420 [Fimbriimonadaceae bacterium]|nr:hypothetical protein [Fimbriimonadaceae bacterium]